MRRFALGLAITLVSAAVLVFAVDWSKVSEVLRGANLKYVVLAVAFLLISTASKTVRWRLLLPDSTVVSVPRLYRIVHVSYLLNNVVPARLGDVARVSMTTHLRGLRVGHVVSSLLTERVTDIVTLLVCFAAVSPFLPLPDEYLRWLHLAWWTLGSLAAIVIAAAAFHRPIARLTTVSRMFERLPLPGWARDEAESFRDGWRQLFVRTHVLRIWSWSGLAWLGAFAINYMLMKALDIEAPLTVAVLLTCTTNLAMLVPSSPSYVGVFHAAATISLLPFDVSASRALSFAILAHLVNVVPVSILGATFLLWGRDRMSFNFQVLWGHKSDPPVDLDEPAPEIV
jgi:hypothetical protein